MVIECEAEIVGDAHVRRVKLADPDRLAPLRKLPIGTAIKVTFDDSHETPSQQRSRLFHALVGAYSKQQGIAAPWVKIITKYRWGTWVSYVEPFRAPRWAAGRFIELPETYPDRLIYLKSVTCYNSGEWSALIDGMIEDCHEAQVDIEEIMSGVKK